MQEGYQLGPDRKKWEVYGGVLPMVVRIEVVQGKIEVLLFAVAGAWDAQPTKVVECDSVNEDGQGIYHFVTSQAIIRNRTGAMGALVRVTLPE